ncbi:MAG: ChaN family lipoprotein [Desulfuromonadia bacterium]
MISPLRPIALLLLLSGCTAVAPVRWHSLGDPVTRGEISRRLSAPRVIFLGEFHDQRSHHDLQLKVIQLLEEKGEPIALGMEMFSVDSQTVLDHWVSGRLPLEDFIGVYRQNWSIDWEEYGVIFRYARNHRIPIIGLNAPLDIVMKVSRSGWNSLSAAERGRLPVGVTPETTPEHRDFMSDAFASHGMDPDRFPFFVQAQGVRNSTMALRIQEALRTHPGRKLVVMTGMGHAVRGGIIQLLPPVIRAQTIVLFPYDDRMIGRIDPEDADIFIIE